MVRELRRTSFPAPLAPLARHSAATAHPAGFPSTTYFTNVLADEGSVQYIVQYVVHSTRTTNYATLLARPCARGLSCCSVNTAQPIRSAPGARKHAGSRRRSASLHSCWRPAWCTATRWRAPPAPWRWRRWRRPTAPCWWRRTCRRWSSSSSSSSSWGWRTGGAAGAGGRQEQQQRDPGAGLQEQQCWGGSSGLSSGSGGSCKAEVLGRDRWVAVAADAVWPRCHGGWVVQAHGMRNAAVSGGGVAVDVYGTCAGAANWLDFGAVRRSAKACKQVTHIRPLVLHKYSPQIMKQQHNK